MSITQFGEPQEVNYAVASIKDTTLKASPHAQPAEALIRFLVGQVLETIFLTFPAARRFLRCFSPLKFNCSSSSPDAVQKTRNSVDISPPLWPPFTCLRR